MKIHEIQTIDSDFLLVVSDGGRSPEFVQVSSIDGVLQNLNDIIKTTRDNHRRAGYFAAFYRRPAIRIRDQIAAGQFDDGKRAERLQIAFANRYFEAYALFSQGGRPTRSWELAFYATHDYWLIVLQHLLLGLNAHINLDLAIAAAETYPAGDLPAFRADFDRIHAQLAHVLKEVVVELGQIWPPFNLTLPLLRAPDETYITFSLNQSREHAWRLAGELAGLTAAARGPIIERHDQQTFKRAETIRNPGVLNVPLMTVRLLERGSVAENIELLQ